MFRRIGARFSAFAVTPVALQAAEASAVTSSSSSNNNNAVRRRRENDNRGKIFDLTPRVDFRKLETVNTTDGYFCRLSFSKNTVLLKRLTQSKVPAAGVRRLFEGPEAYLHLPASTIGRMLAVLDGDMDECKVVGRMYQGTFKVGAIPNTYTLSCKSNNAAAAATTPAATTEDAAVKPPNEWSVEFDVADGILLQRFLKQSLHYMQGFYHADQEAE